MALFGALAMLMLLLMPAAAASIPAVKSAQCPPGYIVSGGYCTPMFRPAPGLRRPPSPGNGISRPETKAPKLLPNSISPLQRQSARTQPPPIGGLDPVGSTPEAFAQQLRAEEEKWAKVIRAGNIKATQ
jgi:hypothetical protein